MEIADFVSRAEGAEKKLAALTARCVELESAVATMDATRGNTGSAAAASSSGFSVPAASKADLLSALAQLRSTLLTEAAERDTLRKENEQLKTKLSKAEYRAEHLVKMLEIEEKEVARLKGGK